MFGQKIILDKVRHLVASMFSGEMLDGGFIEQGDVKMSARSSLIRVEKRVESKNILRCKRKLESQ